VLQISVDAQSPETLYAIAGARVCKSTDGGRNWSILTSELFVNVQAVAADPIRAGRILVGTNSGVFTLGGIFASFDGGATWVARGLNVVRQIWIDPSRPDTVYADDNHGFFRSDDFGGNWKSLTLPVETRSLPFAFAVAADGAAFVGFGSGQFFRSLDRGESWTAASSAPPPFSIVRSIVADPAAPATIWALTPSGLFRSPDRGSSWELRGGGSAASLALVPGNSAVMFAGAAGGVWKSTDGGRTWQPLGVGPPFSAAASVVALAVDPRAPAVVYAGAASVFGDPGQGFFRSEDSGAAWNRFNRGLPGETIFALIADPSNPEIVYAAAFSPGAASIYKSRDGGGSWERVGPADVNGVTRLAIDPVSPSTLYLGTGSCNRVGQCSGEARKTNDGGQSWSKIASLGYVSALAVDPFNRDTVYQSFTCINLLGCPTPVKSADGGKTWEPLPLDGASGVIGQFLPDPTSAGTVYILTHELCVTCSPAGIRSNVFKSTNGGSSWSPAGSGLPVSGVMQTSFSVTRLVMDRDPGSVYAATQRGLFRTTDGGGSWSVTGLTLSVEDLAIDPWDRDVLYAATSASGVLRSLDRGATWQPINAGLPDLAAHAIVIDAAGTALLVTTSNGGVYDLQLPRRIDAVEPRQPPRSVRPRT
jgi:photosystem II stability/assembly factor-like uncharacterized protein